MTPLFGGGVVAGEPDPSFPIRGTSIRGQLQFWWRATCGAVCANRHELFQRHQEVWGMTDKASPVEIYCLSMASSAPKACAKYRWNQAARNGQGGWRLDWENRFHGTALTYALFPFQGSQPAPQRESTSEKQPSNFLDDVRFTLRFRFPKSLRDDVETAVWAWANFGGVGARTQRGCGALYCEEFAPKSASENVLKSWFHRPANSTDHQNREWPTLSSQLLYCSEALPPMDAWNRVIQHLRDFRQGVPLARESGSPAGQSLYPEPDSIRMITKTASRGHEPDKTMVVGFPRAEFGLPLIFHFKDERRGDPFDTALYPFVGDEVKDRMASPIILKPIALSPDKAIPVAVQLNVPLVQRVELQNAKTGECLTPEHSVPVRDKAFAITDSPFDGRSPAGSSLEAFVSFLRNENGFREVTR